MALLGLFIFFFGGFIFLCHRLYLHCVKDCEPEKRLRHTDSGSGLILHICCAGQRTPKFTVIDPCFHKGPKLKMHTVT